MFLVSRKLLATILALAALPLVLAAGFAESRGLFVPVLLLLTAAGAIAFNAKDGRRPGVRDTERFLIGLLTSRGYSGAFRIGEIKQRFSSGRDSASVAVHFRTTVTITEPLYQPTLPSSDICGGYSQRRLASIATIALRLDEELGEPARGVSLRAPADPYHRQYIVARSRQGLTFECTGVAWAAFTPNAGWHYSLKEIARELDVLAQTGRPRAAFPGAVVLDASDGRQWLADTLQAWQQYEAEIAELQSLAQTTRSERGSQAVAEFFATVKAGAVFAGTGTSVTQQLGQTDFALEVTAVDAASNIVQFLLRNGPRREQARRFVGMVSHDALANAVQLAVGTRATDAVAGGGPLVDAATDFELELRWSPADGASTLTGRGGDFELSLREASADAAAPAHERAFERERRIWSAIAPGSSYAGVATTARGEKRLLLVFMPARDRSGIVARLECDGWSGMFGVMQADAAKNGDTYDLVLASAAVPAPVGGAYSALTSDEPWRRVLLRVEDSELTGLIEGAGGSSPVRLRH